MKLFICPIKILSIVHVTKIHKVLIQTKYFIKYIWDIKLKAYSHEQAFIMKHYKYKSINRKHAHQAEYLQWFQLEQRNVTIFLQDKLLF